jgi:hypothetical protein
VWTRKRGSREQVGMVVETTPRYRSGLLLKSLTLNSKHLRNKRQFTVSFLLRIGEVTLTAGMAGSRDSSSVFCALSPS